MFFDTHEIESLFEPSRFRLATAHRYVAEALTVLTALAPALQEAMAVVARKSFVILDGTLLLRGPGGASVSPPGLADPPQPEPPVRRKMVEA